MLIITKCMCNLSCSKYCNLLRLRQLNDVIVEKKTRKRSNKYVTTLKYSRYNEISAWQYNVYEVRSDLESIESICLYSCQPCFFKLVF